ncbi:MAG: DUF1858 domain-containing protein [candidate division Zixibacteria bacterium]|nr:DUF1858 domain-containing protein [candidate division Zixibacteria bacterium]
MTEQNTNRTTVIKSDIHVDDLLERYPELNVFLSRRGIICVQCGEIFWGTLEELIKSKGIDVDKTVAEINAELEKK